MIDAEKFVEWLNPKKLPVSRFNVPAIFVNGKRLTESEERSLRRWKSGQVKSVMDVTADRWAIRFNLALWEIEEAGKMTLHEARPTLSP